jgi:hypothetical protein
MPGISPSFAAATAMSASCLDVRPRARFMRSPLNHGPDRCFQAKSHLLQPSGRRHHCSLGPARRTGRRSPRLRQLS